ncbi:MAG: efflux RND transporter periplasmic adaptor subunit [Cyclobacteriaceae bacterium]|nr:efflux RND transporter periplasmic adaptor subunit [Cyclobacteriaceae bacterium]
MAPHSFNKHIKFKTFRILLENSWSIVVAILMICILLMLNGCTSKDEKINPSVKPLLETVYASGFVKAKDEYQVFADGEGYILRKHIEEGDEVKVGDLLYTLSTRQGQARSEIAKQNLKYARRTIDLQSPILNELKAALASAKTKKDFDSVNYVRYLNLWNQRAVAKIELDKMKLTFDNAKNEYELIVNRYKKALLDVENNLFNAKQQVTIADEDADKNQIRSMLQGRVFSLNKEKGEWVRRGESVAIIGQANSFFLTLQIDEIDINKVKVGQNILVKADAFPDKIFKARLAKIYPLVDVRQQALQVDAELIDALPQSFSGLAVEANIIIRENAKALTVPTQAILPGDSVWVEEKGKPLKKKVLTGIRTFDEVEIVNGVDSQTVVLIKKQ